MSCTPSSGVRDGKRLSVANARALTPSTAPTTPIVTGISVADDDQASLKTNTLTTAACPPRLSSGDNRLSLSLNHDHLRPGHVASILSHSEALGLYRNNAKKTSDPAILLAFARFLTSVDVAQESRPALLAEALKVMKRLVATGSAEAQFELAEMYREGLLNPDGTPEWKKALPLYEQAAKQEIAEASYELGRAYERGLGNKKGDKAKALGYYRKAAARGNVWAMYRLAVAFLQGELGVAVAPREGVKWLTRAAAAAQFTGACPEALYKLARLHETGVRNIVFVDHAYAHSLFEEAASLNHGPSQLELARRYESGHRLSSCAKDADKSVMYYRRAAENGEGMGMFGLATWSLVGGGGLEQSDTEAFKWMQKAAEEDVPKARYALAYFYEHGIGTAPSVPLALHHYTIAHAHGDPRAIKRLSLLSRALPSPRLPVSPSSDQKKGTLPMRLMSLGMRRLKTGSFIET